MNKATVPAIVILLIALISPALICATPNNNPVVCKPSVITQSVALNWSTSDPQFKFLEKIQGLLEKTPFVKKVSFKAALTGALKYGEECCKGALNPTNYTEYSGKGSASFTLDFVGIGGKVGLSLIIPIPWTGIDVGGELLGEAAVSGGGTVGASVSVAGRDGDCDCVILTVEAAATPQVGASIKGKAMIGFIQDNGEINAIVAEVAAAASVNVTFSIPKYKIPLYGKACPPEDKLQVCVKWPTFKFTTTLNLPIPLVPAFDYTFEVDILPLFGLPKESCYPK